MQLTTLSPKEANAIEEAKAAEIKAVEHAKAKAKAEADRAEKDRLARAEADSAEKDRLARAEAAAVAIAVAYEKEKAAAAERAAAERAAAERAAAERAAAERAAAERAAAERAAEQQQKPEGTCSGVSREGNCPRSYDPVLCSNGKTYSNSCAASLAGCSNCKRK